MTQKGFPLEIPFGGDIFVTWPLRFHSYIYVLVSLLFVLRFYFENAV